MDAAPRSIPMLAGFAWLGALLMAVIVVTSAYLRVTQSGVGCEPWPQCYGRIVTEEAAAAPPATAVWIARALHRFAAMTVALVAVAAFVLSLRRPTRDATNLLTTVALLALTVVLTVVGQRSAGSLVPLVAVLNLAGGFAMLALFAALKRHNQPARDSISARRRLVIAVMGVILIAHAALGVLASVTYSADRCARSPLDCGAALSEMASALVSIDPSHAVGVDTDQRIVPPSGAPALQGLHRSLGLALGALAGFVGAWLAGAARLRGGTAIAACAVVASGLVMMYETLRFPATLIHNASAALLLALTIAALGGRSVARGAAD